MAKWFRKTMLILFLCLCGTSHAVTISDITGQVTANSYSNWLHHLYTADGDNRGFTTTDLGIPRVPAHEHDLARDYIFTNFWTMGYDTWLDPFTFTLSGGFLYTNCNNVVAVKPGTGGTNVYIVGAHYDSVDPTTSYYGEEFCPGADDNGSGVAALMEVAWAIQDYTFRDTIILIAFDAEEPGLWGSEHFANQHTTDTPSATNATTFYRPSIKGMISADMLAYNGHSGSNLVQLIGGNPDTNAPVRQALAQAISRYTVNTPVINGSNDWSDHYSFHVLGIDSALLIEYDDWNNPYWHTSSDSTDTPGYLNYAYAAENTKALVGYLCEQARVVPPATLQIYMPGPDAVELRWTTTPGVAYSLYGTESLTQTNPWSFIQYFPETNTATEILVPFDPIEVPKRLFRVESE